MFTRCIACFCLVCLLGAAGAQETASTAEAVAQAPERQAIESQPNAPQAPTEAAPQVKTLSGMSILGNEEAPKSLVIVPWKSSEIGDGVGVEDLIDARARPVDKEVFLREVRYYQLRSATAD